MTAVLQRQSALRGTAAASGRCAYRWNVLRSPADGTRCRAAAVETTSSTADVQLAKQQLYDAIAYTRRGAAATSHIRGQIEEAQVCKSYKATSCAQAKPGRVLHLHYALLNSSCHAPSRGSFHRQTGSVWQRQASTLHQLFLANGSQYSCTTAAHRSASRTSPMQSSTTTFWKAPGS